MKELKPFANQQSRVVVIDTIIFDLVMPYLTKSEWCILSLIIRKTVGWDKDEDKISYNQFNRLTPVKGKRAISNALSGLEAKGLITRDRNGSFDIMSYSLNLDFTIHVADNGYLKFWQHRPGSVSEHTI